MWAINHRAASESLIITSLSILSHTDCTYKFLTPSVEIRVKLSHRRQKSVKSVSDKTYRHQKSAKSMKFVCNTPHCLKKPRNPCAIPSPSPTIAKKSSALIRNRGLCKLWVRYNVGHGLYHPSLPESVFLMNYVYATITCRFARSKVYAMFGRILQPGRSTG